MTRCPGCHSSDIDVFFSVDDVPTNSALLLDTREEAVSLPVGQIRLSFCGTCGHVFNAAFKQALAEYSGRYESTQGYSAVFNSFHRRLADDMIDRFDLHDREVIEIGCGNGEFLVMLCERGGNRGVGFDPAYQPGRVPIPEDTHVTFVADFYGDEYTDHSADFVVCKMTLEHIIDTRQFVTDLRKAIGDRPDTHVCFQIPNADYVIGDQAFWDVYYEHCQYFSPGSLAHLFRSCGFEVDDLWTDYDDQYLVIAARPSVEPTGKKALPRQPAEKDVSLLADEVQRFRLDVPVRLDVWRRRISDAATSGRRIVLWGGGSKAVAFLTTLGIGDEILGAVDINPNKQGTYLARTGHRVIGPDELASIRPDEVIVMNPIYLEEIRAQLHAMDLDPTLTPIE